MSQPYAQIQPDLFTNHAGAELHIDLSALTYNYQYLQQKVAPTTCAAVVKANAYSLGMIPIAKTLYKAGCRDFFVAHLDEGIALRSILNIECKIYVLHGLPIHTEKLFIDHHLIPILNNIEQVKRWSSLCHDHHYPYPAGIQFDTGMSRFGIGSDELDQLQYISWKSFQPSLVMSHLACADTPEHPANTYQLKQFQQLRQLIPQAPASLSASSGIFLGKEWHFDLVRPGIALYGGNPTPFQNNPMRHVISLLGKIIQIRHIHPGAFIGYGASFTATKPMKIALLSIGYADGFFRSLSQKINAIHPSFPNISLPLLGRISMDSLCIDVSDLPDNAIKTEDYIELIGSHYSIDAIGTAGNTIGYEVLTSLGNRYHHIYK